MLPVLHLKIIQLFWHRSDILLNRPSPTHDILSRSNLCIRILSLVYNVLFLTHTAQLAVFRFDNSGAKLLNSYELHPQAIVLVPKACYLLCQYIEVITFSNKLARLIMLDVR
jgi:hypothetical protein